MSMKEHQEGPGQIRFHLPDVMFYLPPSFFPSPPSSPDNVSPPLSGGILYRCSAEIIRYLGQSNNRDIDVFEGEEGEDDEEEDDEYLWREVSSLMEVCCCGLGFSFFFFFFDLGMSGKLKKCN